MKAWIVAYIVGFGLWVIGILVSLNFFSAPRSESVLFIISALLMFIAGVFHSHDKRIQKIEEQLGESNNLPNKSFKRTEPNDGPAA
jgi:hypothetical protein